MPRFLDPNAEELNSLLRPKMRMLKDLKRQYRGTETTIGLEGDLVDKYNRIYDSMIKLIASLGEINNTLNLGGNANKEAMKLLQKQQHKQEVKVSLVKYMKILF